MFRKYRMASLVFVVAAVALVALAGCTMRGGGTVSLSDVLIAGGDGLVPGATTTPAQISVAASCIDQGNKIRIQSVLHVTDNANGLNVTAVLPSTSTVIEEGITCADLEDSAPLPSGLTAAAAPISSPQGETIGEMVVLVSEPGASIDTSSLGEPFSILQPASCASDERTVVIEAVSDDPGPVPGGGYLAIGCLSHGNITIN